MKTGSVYINGKYVGRIREWRITLPPPADPSEKAEKAEPTEKGACYE